VTYALDEGRPGAGLWAALGRYQRRLMECVEVWGIDFRLPFIPVCRAAWEVPLPAGDIGKCS